MNLVLIGYRGTGKSTVGKILAGRLDRRFVDLDIYIESNQNKSIKEIFEEGGEELFRKIEADAIKELHNQDNIVIAPGGGAILCEENVINLKQNGFIVLLEADDETIYARLNSDVGKRSQRPKLTDKSELEEIKEKQIERRPIYKKTADFIINTSFDTLEDVCEKIITEFNKQH